MSCDPAAGEPILPYYMFDPLPAEIREPTDLGEGDPYDMGIS